MKKKIIVPTDFSVASLHILKSVLQEQADSVYDIVFIHGYHLSDTISNLLFYKKSRILDRLCNEDFEEALYILKNKFHNRIGSIRRELFTGWNKAAFVNFIEGLASDEILITKDYKFSFKDKGSFDLMTLIKKSGLKTREMSWKYNSDQKMEESLSDIFMPATQLIRS